MAGTDNTVARGRVRADLVGRRTIFNNEERRYPVGKATPQQMLQHLMEARKLKQKDLWKIFGSKGITSEVFHGKRSIGKTQAKKLAEFFHVSTELFI
jgi:HTH-type transcriptional regulator/antitoxin HigA